MSEPEPAPEPKKVNKNRPPLRREDAITSSDEEFTEKLVKQKEKKVQKKKKPNRTFDSSSSDSEIEKKQSTKKKIEKSTSSDKKAKKKVSIDINEKPKKIKDKNREKPTIKPKPQPIVNDNDSDTDEYGRGVPINKSKKNEFSNKKINKKKSVLESDSSDSDEISTKGPTVTHGKNNTKADGLHEITPVLSKFGNTPTKNKKLSNTTFIISSDSSDDSDVPSRPNKPEKKAKVYFPPTKVEESTPNKKLLENTPGKKNKERVKEKNKMKKSSIEDVIREDNKKKKKDKDGLIKNKIHKKEKPKENDIGRFHNKTESISNTFTFSDSDSSLSSFQRDRAETIITPSDKLKSNQKKGPLSNLFDFETDGSSSDLPELVVETTSSKRPHNDVKGSSILDKLELEFAEDKPSKNRPKDHEKVKQEPVKKEVHVNGERDPEKTKKKKLKKKKKQDDGNELRIKTEPQGSSKMPALAKVPKEEVDSSPDVKDEKSGMLGGDNIFEKMEMKEEQMPVLESEAISSDDVDKLEEYGDPPSDLQIETQDNEDEVRTI